MFDSIIAYSIKHKFVVGLMVIALIVVGSYSLNNLPIDALPDITNNQVQIITTSPNLATQEVELFITYPIELAVKAIPEIVELRSTTRFGLSIVTVVFEEDTDIYWARTQIVERLKEAEENIPSGYGRPQLSPISTGLGEIYQYTVFAAPGYEKEFNIMELRTVQDWIIVPQLLGVSGVAEVNTLGGVLKEYEVSVNPDRLKSLGVTMAEIFEALHRNNENTGGAYIDKKPNAYFIRSIGMVNSIEDIQKIVVKTQNDIPILIRDIAEVRFGSAIRYGAATKNGKGEVVNGMVMMLKGENSQEIVLKVKEQMAKIIKTLPKGVEVEPFLDRSKLVDRAIATVRTNLIEGALIVIFILVLLIGNWRAGLIVATVIPLALLFAVTMMKLFGVSGNLMSLGAIDFGLIVDGAVIIVEAIVHRLQNIDGTKRLNAKQIDEEVYAAASKIRTSAAFGEIIILIVYLPILALVGIEGKMFRPMAQTVSFAILGAFILSLTYVPMMSALFLRNSTSTKKNLSDRIIDFFHWLYRPILDLALKIKPLVLLAAIGCFVVSILTFNKLGGEFIPTLDEGDIAMHIIIPPGSSLEQEIETTTKAEKLILEHLPQVEQAVSKIGSAEVPTDPMPMEVADLMLILKDKSEWGDIKSKEEMFVELEKVVADLPGVTTEYSQPIQMRFNELMTGIRSDVGVKIFGEDIERLVALGDEAAEIINSVWGVEGVRAETVSGLPQITIKYNKDKLALYGLNVDALNQSVSMGFAGQKAGVVYEGEKKFDLVVRLAEPYRQSITNIKNLDITLPSGRQMPLEQVADIRFERGPAQISRENGKRRIVVGFNVRNRDVQSVVSEIKEKIAAQIKMPPGYYTAYAGQFENLIRANQRLSVAVPVALALIFVLLYMTFHSVKQSILIFMAIPLSAIGGVFALWLRDMPFSISAGVGFIALFGVAVLNGIVLIAYFNQLKEEGMTDSIERIKEGTRVRLRPVIMTASVASLGFLPMALSNSAGAEVQKPLATVVIGGLITATLLTLLVLPILYYYSEKEYFKKSGPVLSVIFVLVLGVSAGDLVAQTSKSITLDQAISMAMESNKSLAAASLDIQRQEQMKGTILRFPKADIEGAFGQLNSRDFDHSYSISQRFNPYSYKVKGALIDQQVAKGKLDLDVQKQEIVYEIKQVWNEILYHKAVQQLVKEQLPDWKKFADHAALKLRVGETNQLEKIVAEAKLPEFDLYIQEAAGHVLHHQIYLNSLLQSEEKIEVAAANFTPLEWTGMADSTLIANNPMLRSALQDVKIANAQKAIYASEKKPDFTIGYFIQSFQGDQTKGTEVISYNAVPQFQGVKLGVSIPIFGRKSYSASAKVAETDQLVQQAEADYLKTKLTQELSLHIQEIINKQNVINYYKNTAIPTSQLVVANAQRTYVAGATGYLELINALDHQFEIQKAYLEAIKTYNTAVIALRFLLNE